MIENIFSLVLTIVSQEWTLLLHFVYTCTCVTRKTRPKKENALRRGLHSEITSLLGLLIRTVSYESCTMRGVSFLL